MLVLGRAGPLSGCSNRFVPNIRLSERLLGVFVKLGSAHSEVPFFIFLPAGAQGRTLADNVLGTFGGLWRLPVFRAPFSASHPWADSRQVFRVGFR